MKINQSWEAMRKNEDTSAYMFGEAKMNWRTTQLEKVDYRTGIILVFTYPMFQKLKGKYIMHKLGTLMSWM